MSIPRLPTIRARKWASANRGLRSDAGLATFMLHRKVYHFFAVYKKYLHLEPITFDVIITPLYKKSHATNRAAKASVGLFEVQT